MESGGSRTATLRPDAQISIAPGGQDAAPWTYLTPVVEAEQRWGNEPFGEFHDNPDGWAQLVFRQPLHIDQLRDTFMFPSYVVLVDDEKRTEVNDGRHRVSIVAGPSSGARPPGPSFVAMLLKRFRANHR